MLQYLLKFFCRVSFSNRLLKTSMWFNETVTKKRHYWGFYIKIYSQDTERVGAGYTLAVPHEETPVSCGASQQLLRRRATQIPLVPQRERAAREHCGRTREKPAPTSRTAQAKSRSRRGLDRRPENPKRKWQLTFFRCCSGVPESSPPRTYCSLFPRK